MEGDGFWLKCKAFTIEPGEDASTNPGCYGKALAHWIANALKKQGIDVLDVLAEGWGWCVRLKSHPYSLWIGCGNVQNDAPLDDIIWHCFVTAEVPFWKFWVRWSSGAQLKADVSRVRSALQAAFANDASIQLVPEP